MSVACVNATSVNFNQHIYAIGGDGNVASKSVECFNLKDSEAKWKHNNSNECWKITMQELQFSMVC